MLYFGALLERGLHLHLCVHDDHLRTRLVLIFFNIYSRLTISSNPLLLFEILLNQKCPTKRTKKSFFLKQTIHSLQLGNVMLGKEQGSSKQTKGRIPQSNLFIL